MTHASEMMVHYGHVEIISRDPLILHGTTPIGTRFLRDTTILGIIGFFGKYTIANSIDEL